MKLLKNLISVAFILLLITSCSQNKDHLTDLETTSQTNNISGKKTVGEPSRCIRYGTNPRGADNPKSRDVLADGTVILHFECSNSPDICYHYGAVNPGDDITQLTAMEEEGVWYEAVYNGTIDVPGNLQDDQISILP